MGEVLLAGSRVRNRSAFLFFFKNPLEPMKVPFLLLVRVPLCIV